MPIGKPTPTPKPKTQGVMGKPRTASGISGSGSSNVNKDYKETGTQKSFIDKLKKAYDIARTIPPHGKSLETIKKELENEMQRINKKENLNPKNR